jgi:hypothetical protein
MLRSPQVGLLVVVVAINGMGVRTDVRIFNAMKRAEHAARRARSVRKVAGADAKASTTSPKRKASGDQAPRAL